jgi:hypothetical protein
LPYASLVTKDGDGDRPEDPDWIAELAAQRPGHSETVPRGRSVSSALILPPGVLPHDLELRSLLATIDSVHADGKLPPLRFRWGVPRTGEVAVYTVADDLSQPVRLAVDSRRARWQVGVIHEIGHFLDHQGIDSPVDFASRSGRLLEDWRTAVRLSRAVGALQRFPEIGSYLGRPEEVWARCYVQWIALRSGNPSLRRQVVELRGHDSASAEFYAQWEDDDFAPIADALDRLFRRLKWIA